MKHDPTIRLHSGKYFDLLEPTPEMVRIDDIAHALSHLCRFTGHTDLFYSVAQHSVMVSQIVPAEYALAGLLHDAAEAYLGDVAKPLKRLLPDYQAIEKRVEAAVFARFGLPAELPDCVKHADIVMLRTEQRDLMRADKDVWFATKGVVPLSDTRIRPWYPSLAQARFLDRFEFLTYTPSYCEVS